MIIIGCDFHSRSQQIAMLDTETGELIEKKLEHENGEAKEFYEGLKEPALVGIETTGYTRWFAEMLAELGHELMVGEAGKIRASETRKQKHDRRDAWHIMELMAAGKFPRIWLPSAKERDVRVLVEHRHQLVQMRTRAKNGLQAMALSYALRKRRQLWSVRGQEELQKIPLREGMGRRRFHPFNVYSEKKRLEKLNDMHNNPVKRGLLVHPGDWPWSSWRFYYRGDPLLLAMDR